MWQLYALGAIITSAAQTIFDKAAIMGNVNVDSMVASFWRSFLYTLFTILIGLVGIIGPFDFFFHWSMVLMALIGSGTSLGYTYILKRVEVTSISSIGYVAPVLFLIIDTHIAHIGLGAIQGLGVILLAIGGLLFTVDGKTLRFKKELNWIVWSIFLFDLAYGAADAYLFKYLHTAYGVNGVSFFASLWSLCSLYILILVVVMRKFSLVFTRSSWLFIARSSTGKSFDAINSVLWAQALTLASVSQVSSFDATYPLILFILILLVQEILRIPIGERMDKSRLGWKAIATIFLVVGGFLVA